MKKVIGWILIVLAITASILCFIFPVQAKEVSENIMNVLNTPVVIAGISTTIGGIIAFVIARFIMNNSKFGKKELDDIRKDFEQTKNDIDDYIYNFDSWAKALESTCDETRIECNNQVTVMLDQFENLQNNVLNALKTIPNKKVQAIVEQYESEYEIKKQEIINKTVNTNEYVDEKIAEMKKQFEEFMERISNERKETVDNQTEEEQE